MAEHCVLTVRGDYSPLIYRLNFLGRLLSFSIASSLYRFSACLLFEKTANMDRPSIGFCIVFLLGSK